MCFRILIYLQIGVVQGTLTALSHMDKSAGGKGGTVVNIGSIAGLGRGMNVTPVYNATKHAVIGLSHTFGVRNATRISVIL
jgi:15-hydroxyprostaglandin dehydrogenase (NAD)